MLLEETKQLLVDKIIEKLDPAFVLLFGSFAKGVPYAASDIDLVDIKQIDTVFLMQIMEHGIPIYVKKK